jgi:hypothetical protein
MKENNKYTGKWRITEMEQWDMDYIDSEVPGYFEFDDSGFGEFQFGYVEGQMDCTISEHKIEFSWNGSDEMDEASGRGWCTLKSNKEIEGMIYFHCGDNSAFEAIKLES